MACRQATKKASKFSAGRQAAAPGSVRASRQVHAPSVLMQMALKQNENQGKGKKKKIGTKEAPLALPAYASDSLFQHQSSEGHCLVEALPASRRPSSSLCLCCSCHLPLHTAAGMPRDASAYNTEHQVITTAPSCAALVPPCAAQPAVGAALGNWSSSRAVGALGLAAARRPVRGLSTSCSAPAPGRAHCGAASR